MKTILMHTNGKYEVWLCTIQDGTLKPMTSTFPLSIPPEWREAIQDFDRKRDDAIHKSMAHE